MCWSKNYKNPKRYTKKAIAGGKWIKTWYYNYRVLCNSSHKRGYFRLRICLYRCAMYRCVTSLTMLYSITCILQIQSLINLYLSCRRNQRRPNESIRTQSKLPGLRGNIQLHQHKAGGDTNMRGREQERLLYGRLRRTSHATAWWSLVRSWCDKFWFGMWNRELASSVH